MSDDDVVADCAAALERLQKAVVRARTVIHPLAKGDTAAAARALRKAPTTFTELVSSAARTADPELWGRLQGELRSRHEEAQLDVGSAIENALNGQFLSWTGAFPTYRVSSGARIEVDPVANTARVGERSFDYIDAREIAQAARRYGTRRRSKVRTEGFPTLLARAYEDVVSEEALDPTQFVPITKLHKRVATLIGSEYPRARFSSDLGMALTDRSQGPQFETAPARNRRDSIQVEIAGDSITVGSLRPAQPTIEG